ncbi:hypothetical protein HYALB_00008003 [Hymenoscyphus albidus]|uniref:Uncharacterized protein n=1 Tax=Hymenoscyphus albidus TaxID=595503 RepID=A0A9N9PXD1_9HELO|nr:hypothetical protein HYALB_00008003 [Hymenoscyphus albidus]
MEARKTSRQPQRPQPSPVQIEPGKASRSLPFIHKFLPPIPPKHPGRLSQNQERRILPLAGPAHTYHQNPPKSKATEDSALPQPPTSPVPYLSPQAYRLFNFSPLLPKNEKVIHRQPLGLNIQKKYLDQTPNTFFILELQDTINRTYGTDFDMSQITSLARDAEERGNLVEVRPWVYQFDVADQQEKMARYIKERAQRKRHEGADGKAVWF